MIYIAIKDENDDKSGGVGNNFYDYGIFLMTIKTENN